MPDPTVPGTTSRCDDPGFDDYEDCSWCGGSGVEMDGCTCGDDTCCCLHPEPPECHMCGGAG